MKKHASQRASPAKRPKPGASPPRAGKSKTTGSKKNESERKSTSKVGAGDKKTTTSATKGRIASSSSSSSTSGSPKKATGGKSGSASKTVGTIRPLDPKFASSEIITPALASDVKTAFVQAARHMAVRGCMAPKPAVVLDIDDTALVGPDESQRTHGPVHSFYKKAIDSGVKVFFVTARSEAEPGNRESTVKQLRDCGYDKFDALFMAPRFTPHFKGIKKAHREAITKKGYDIVVNAGDQWADLVEGSVPPVLEAALGRECMKRPLVFYNGKENSCLCIKLWS